MKKLLFLFLLIFPMQVLGISASSAITMDMDNGRILYGYNTDNKLMIASTTKIMTAIIAIENGNLDEVIEITDEIYKAYGSAIYIEVGEKLTLRDLLYGLMLRSGNDAALVIAKYIAGSKEEFVFLMNEYATNLKMTNTVFYNPHGLEENDGNANLSTTHDMAILTKYAMQNSVFREIFSTKKYTVKSNYKTYVWHNKNKLLSEEYITGGKTGFTEKARRTLVTTGSQDNVNLIVVTLNDPNDWADHRELYTSSFKKYKNYQLIQKKDFQIKEDDYYKENELYIKNDIKMTLTKEELKKVVVNYNLLKLDNYIDDTLVGYAEVKLDDIIYHKEPIYVRVEKEEENLSWWQKFLKWVHKW